MLKKHWVVLGFFLLAPAAFAQEDGGGKTFDVLGGFAAGAGNSALRVGIGQPGLETVFLYGITSHFTIGGLLALNWGEGFDFAVRFQIPVRYTFYDSGRLGITGGFTPGVAILAGGGSAAVSIPLPFDLTTGFRITRELSLMVGFEIPLEIWTKGKAAAIIPLVAASGFEYRIASSVKLWSRIRVGHAFTAGGGDGGGGYDFDGDYDFSGAGSMLSRLGGGVSGHVGIAIGF